MARAPRDTAEKKPRLRALPGRAAATATAEKPRPPDAEETLAYARGVLEAEARAILGVTERLGESFLRALGLLRDCPGLGRGAGHRPD
jgi:arabinose-5-phosphate isomerase